MSGTGPNNDVLNWGRVGKWISSIARLTDGLPVVGRFSPYGDQVAEILSSKQHVLAGEGSYFICRTPTVGTGIAGVTSLTSYTATSPFMILFNNNPAGGRDIFIDYTSMTCTATAASTTSLFLVTALDTTQRYSSAGSGGAGTNVSTALIGPYATNEASPLISGAQVYMGALVATAASPQVRILSNRLVRQQIPVVLDQYIVNYGTDAVGGPLSPQVLSAAVPAVSTIAHAPVCVPPQTSFLLYYYGAAMAAAPSFEGEIGFVER
jgi:hypothetical protein